MNSERVGWQGRGLALALALFLTVTAGRLAHASVGEQGAAAPQPTVSAIDPASQAGRGKVVYESACQECHGAHLEGVEEVRAPALAGDRFWFSWDKATVADLLQRVTNTMPQSAPGSLSRDEYLAVTAFLLHANSVNVGAGDVSNDIQVLKTLKIARPAGA